MSEKSFKMANDYVIPVSRRSRHRVIWHGYFFSQIDCQLLIALSMWIGDRQDKPLSDGTKSQIMLWRRSRQGSMPIGGLFDALMASKDPYKQAWVDAVLEHREIWTDFGQQAHDDMMGNMLWMKTSEEMLASDDWGRSKQHRPVIEEMKLETAPVGTRLEDERARSGAEANRTQSQEATQPRLITLAIDEVKTSHQEMDSQILLDGWLKVNAKAGTKAEGLESMSASWTCIKA
ncbi:MAG: hypothetical protein Q9164_000866 [Protoblastenia rupestris]